MSFACRACGYITYRRHLACPRCGLDGTETYTMQAADKFGCTHTEHAWRGHTFVGRYFPKDGPPEGSWEYCTRM